MPSRAPQTPGSLTRPVESTDVGTWIGAPGGTAPPAAGAPTVPGATQLNNNAAPSPLLNEQVNLVRERLGRDTTQRQLDRSNLSIADSAALLAKDAKANTARRGVTDTSAADAYLNKNIFQPAQRAAAGAAADIVQGEERRKDSLVLGSTPIFQAPDQFSLANRRLGLDQWSAQSADERARAGMQLDADAAQLARYLALREDLYPQGGGGGTGTEYGGGYTYGSRRPF